MSCGGDQTQGWSNNMPVVRASQVIAGMWATRVKIIGNNVVSAGQPMVAGQQTVCTMSFGNATQYHGSSGSGYHAEVDALVQAHAANEALANGQFVALTNACCLICATALFAVGIVNLPAIANSKKEYANYALPEFMFDDEANAGYLHRLLGTNAWTVWTNHLSAPTRAKPENRQGLITMMTQSL
jgi:deoxycytidylate deaminase